MADQKVEEVKEDNQTRKPLFQKKQAMRFNMNLITPENFDIVKDQMLEIAILNVSFSYLDSKESCEQVADFIADNVWSQPLYVETFARLCDYLGKLESLNFGSPQSGDNVFKVHILKHMSAIYDEDPDTENSLAKLSYDEQERVLNKKKRKLIGNIAFLAHLFLLDFIPRSTISTNTITLLNIYLKKFDTYQKASVELYGQYYEDVFEGLIKLLEIIGPTLQKIETTSETQTNSTFLEEFGKAFEQACSTETRKEPLYEIKNQEITLDQVFKVLDILLNSYTLSIRIECLVNNLIERRKDNWQEHLTSELLNFKPKTKQEIRQDFEKQFGLTPNEI